MFDVIIIGGGPAGLTASVYASRAGLSCLVLEKMAPGGQTTITNLIENHPGFQSIYGWDLATQLAEQATASGAKILLEEAVGCSLTGAVKTVKTETNLYEAKTVIFAQGSTRKKLNVPGEDAFLGKGVSYCATCDGNFYKGKTVAVVGGGNTAVGDAIQLSKICKTVYLIHRRESFRAMDYLEKQRKALPNITVFFNSVVDSITGSNKVEGIQVRNGKTAELTTISVNGVFVAVGMQPNAELLQGVLPLADGFVEAGESGETQIPGLFVAGDLRKKAFHQIITAESDGANAAYSAQLYLQNNA
jgi:thioredoxin reductase (NADPH)